MKISIIIPVYKVELYIKRCILSVLNQIYQDIEIILVDDSSPDKSIEISEDIINHHPNKNKVVFVSHQHNRGLSAARNTGVNIAKGDYLYFLDSDDELPLDAIEILVNTAIEYGKPDFVVGNFEIINDTQNKVLKYELSNSFINSSAKILELYADEKWPTTAWNKLINTEFFKSNGLYFKEAILHEDVVWSVFLANRATSMGVVDKNTYKYFIRESSITGKIRSKNINSYCIIIEEIRNAINADVLSTNENNSKILGRIRDTTLKRLFYLENKEEQYFFFKKVRNVKITRTSLPLSKKVVDLILKLPVTISFHIFKLLIR